MIFDELFPEAYVPNISDFDIFEGRYNPPKTFLYGADYVVARYPKVGGDGYPVEVLETRLPAQFYTIRVLPSPNSMGKPRPGFKLGTGSGCARLAHEIAKAVSQGMLAIEHDD